MQPRKIAKERIEILFEQADKRPEKAERYVELARRIGERVQMPLPKKFRNRFCSSCGTYWQYGESCTVRVKSDEQVVEYICKDCGETERYPY